MKRVSCLLALLAGCGGSDAAQSPQSPTPAASPPKPVASSVPPPTAAPSVSASAPAPEPPPPQERFPGSKFPPENFEPPHARSAQPGDGEWKAFGAGQERVLQEPRVVYSTVVHPHKVSKWQKVTIAAMDLEHTQLDYRPGKTDVEAEAMPAGVERGLVPESEQDRLLLVFNGGFQPQHGNWGMFLRGKDLVAPKPEGCTVAIYDDGKVRIRSWPVIEADVKSGKVVAYRQTPPCLLEEGELHPKLKAHNDRPWGGRDPKRKTRRRSSVGIDASGRMLLYGMGDETPPRMLAEGMRAAGAVSAAQLDINWSWTRFLVFSEQEGTLRVTSTLIPQMVHGKKSYVERAASRDFFYLLRRSD